MDDDAASCASTVVVDEDDLPLQGLAGGGGPMQNSPRLTEYSQEILNIVQQRDQLMGIAEEAVARLRAVACPPFFSISSRLDARNLFFTYFICPFPFQSPTFTHIIISPKSKYP